MIYTPNEALAVLRRCNALGDFHAMSSGDVDALLAEADRARYRKSKNAPGSRARMFHAFLTRRAHSLTHQAREAVKGRNVTVTLGRDRRRVTASSW